MRSLIVVEGEVAADTPPSLRGGAVLTQIDFLVFQAAPESFDENIIKDSATAAHANSNLVLGEDTGPASADKLNSLIGVTDLRGSVLFQGPAERPHTEVAFQGIARVPIPSRSGYNGH